MGPIERELREKVLRPDKRLGIDAYELFVGSMFSLYDQWDLRGTDSDNTRGHWPDIMSEAIEAAEALGL